MGKLPFERQEAQVFIKKEAETSPKYGCRPSERTTKDLFKLGIVNIDKPKGPTSHQIAAYVQKIMGVSKGGHSGTLDPKVTGVLPTAIGRGTRVVQALLVAGKEYICLMHLHKELPEEKVREVMASFVGKITQLPPLKSAVKRQVRSRKIYYIDIHEIKGQEVLFTVGCQAGTYIRKLCHDIGVKLGTGAHMAELRRTKAGPFNEDSLVTMQDLTDAMWYYTEEGNDKYLRSILQPVENGVAHLPKVWILDSAVSTVCHGADVGAPGVSKVSEGLDNKDQLVAVMTLKDELVALGLARMTTKETLNASKGIAVKVKKVFMDVNVYPKMGKKEQ